MTRCLGPLAGRALRGLLRVATVLSLVVFLGLCALLLDGGIASRELECAWRRDGGGGRVVGAYGFDARIYLGVIDGRRGAGQLEPGLSFDADPGWTRCMLYRGLMYRPGAGGAAAGFAAADVADVDERIGGEVLGWTGVRVRGVMVPLGFALCAAGAAPGAWCVAWCRRRGWLHLTDADCSGENAAPQARPSALGAFDVATNRFRLGRWVAALASRPH